MGEKEYFLCSLLYFFFFNKVEVGKHFHWRTAISSLVTLSENEKSDTLAAAAANLTWFFFPFPPTLAPGFHPPVGVTLGWLRARWGQRWHAQGCRWRIRWWRSESPTSLSPRGEGSPSPRRRSWLVLDSEEQVRGGGGGVKESLTNCRSVARSLPTSVCFFETDDTGAKRTRNVRTWSSSLVLTDDISDLVLKRLAEKTVYSFPLKKNKAYNYKVFLKDAFIPQCTPAVK